MKYHIQKTRQSKVLFNLEEGKVHLFTGDLSTLLAVRLCRNEVRLTGACCFAVPKAPHWLMFDRTETILEARLEQSVDLYFKSVITRIHSNEFEVVVLHNWISTYYRGVILKFLENLKPIPYSTKVVIVEDDSSIPIPANLKSEVCMYLNIPSPIPRSRNANS